MPRVSIELSDLKPLPAGWDCKVDNQTGNRYYINYFTRQTSMEDPRVEQESIPLQELSSNTRLGLMMGTNSLKRQQSSLDTQPANTTDQSVAKISAMFPTVSETHIRTLLLKYHNREAVVLSALQVEKHPLTTPGPYTPPLGARVLPGLGLYAVTPPHTPHHLPARLARPHSSPKMKLRYLKSVFPVVEETVLLDTLSSSDNNVHQATEALLTMGFDKRATPPPRVCLQRQTPPPPSRSSAPAQPPPRMKSVAEKQDMKVRLRSKHPDIPERVVSIALDSVDFDETRADQILAMVDKPTDKPSADSSELEVERGGVGKEKVNEIIVEEPSPAASPESPPDLLLLTSEKQPTPGSSRPLGNAAESKSYQSVLTRPAVGPNFSLRRGPNQSLLLVSHRPDYVAWVGSGSLARGPDPSLRGLCSPAQGPDPCLRKGPNRSLAKGSIYSRLATLSLAESRGK